ncbi:hypothetical protein [Luteibacter sp. CQ10]|uniref:hypothetical protein n=1 Tax=Luteibacter sp. CQ10 TaxID=2805821 RepID=UPI0034A5D489
MSQRDDLERMLGRLDAEVESDLRDNPDPDAFWPAFAQKSNAVLEAAGPEHFDWVSSEVSAILHRHGVSAPEA